MKSSDYHYPTVTPDEHGANKIEQWVVLLNRYERDNLLWLLTEVLGWNAPGVEPFQAAHTGDWVGQIAQKLADPDAHNPLFAKQPNIQTEEFRKMVERRQGVVGS